MNENKPKRRIRIPIFFLLGFTMIYIFTAAACAAEESYPVSEYTSAKSVDVKEDANYEMLSQEYLDERYEKKQQIKKQLDEMITDTDEQTIRFVGTEGKENVRFCSEVLYEEAAVNPFIRNKTTGFTFLYQGDDWVGIVIKEGGLDSEKEQQVKNKLDEIVSHAETIETDSAKALYVNNRICESCRYEKDEEEKERETVYGCLVNKKASCLGYAKSFQAAMEELGIPCMILIANDASHCWNAVKINGKWRHIDVTWNTGRGENNYFLEKGYVIKRVPEHGIDIQH